MEKKTIEIKALSRKQIENFITDRAHILISVKDPDIEAVITPENPNQVARLDLCFNDVDIQNQPELINIPKIRAFNEDDAASILQVYKLTDKYIDLIVINCMAGISRSAGIAAALSRIINNDDGEYFNPRGPYRPNRYVYRTILNVAVEMGLHGY